MNLFLIVVIIGLLVIIFSLVKNNEKPTQKIETKNSQNTSKNTPNLPIKTIEVESPDYKDIKEFNSIQELKIYIKKEMEDRIGLIENKDIPFLYQRKDDNEINANITLKKNLKSVYIYIDFNLMYKDSSWNKDNIINLNLCINDEKLKDNLSKKFSINSAYSIRNTYTTKDSDPLSKKYCGDLKITSLKDLEEVLKISKNSLKQ